MTRKSPKPPVDPKAAAYPGVPITKAEYERMIHEMIEAATVSPRRTVLEAPMGRDTSS